jgi:hypothetical protein
MLIQEKINAPDTLLKLYVAIDEDLKALQPQLYAKQLPRDPCEGTPTLSAALSLIITGPEWKLHNFYRRLNLLELGVFVH